jgi:hypothetical protein
MAAYIILPRCVRMGLKILQRKRVPRYAITGDGLPGDPVNLVLTGTLGQLHAAFATAGWSTADRLGLTMRHELLTSIRIQLSLSHGPIQHSLSFWTRPRYRFPEGDR